MTKRPDLSALLKELLPFVSRTHPRFRELTGYSPRTVANYGLPGPRTEKADHAGEHRSL